MYRGAFPGPFTIFQSEWVIYFSIQATIKALRYNPLGFHHYIKYSVHPLDTKDAHRSFCTLRHQLRLLLEMADRVALFSLGYCESMRAASPGLISLDIISSIRFA